VAAGVSPPRATDPHRSPDGHRRDTLVQKDNLMSSAITSSEPLPELNTL